MRVTIRDVAKQANCSTTAVSLVLNEKADNVSPETRRRVFETAERLGYRPNRLAADLAKGKTRTIGLIIPDNRNPFFGTILNYVEAEADKAGYRVIAGNSNDSIVKDIAYIDAFLSYCVAGIIIVRANTFTRREDVLLQNLIRNCSTPVVAIDRVFSGVTVPTFAVDNRLGGFIATKHLLDMGHRRIGCYTGPMSAWSAQRRLLGYKEAMEAAGMAFAQDMLYEGNYQMSKDEDVYRYFMDREVTAVFAHNDMQAFGLYKYAQLSGRRIPDDCSLIGFDNLDFGAIITPGLSSIRYPVEQLTHDAVDCLINMVEYGGESRFSGMGMVEYAPELVSRDSVMCLNRDVPSDAHQP